MAGFVIIPISLQCAGRIKLQESAPRTLKIRKLIEEFFDDLDADHCRKSKMDAYTFRKLQTRPFEKLCSPLILKNGYTKWPVQDKRSEK
jgi:hypothetical protein